MAELRVRCSPASLASAAGLDPAVVLATVRGFVRTHHAEPVPDPHEGPAEEEVVITAIARSRGQDLRLTFTYWQNRWPRSRYDKSQQADGSLRLSGDARDVRTGELGPLELCTLG